MIRQPDFKFTSSTASRKDEVFEAYKDFYNEGYAVFDEGGRTFILTNEQIDFNLVDGNFVRVK